MSKSEAHVFSMAIWIRERWLLCVHPVLIKHRWAFDLFHRVPVPCDRRKHTTYVRRRMHTFVAFRWLILHMQKSTSEYALSLLLLLLHSVRENKSYS